MELELEEFDDGAALGAAFAFVLRLAFALALPFEHICLGLLSLPRGPGDGIIELGVLRVRGADCYKFPRVIREPVAIAG